MEDRVLGVDACRGGWVGVAVGGEAVDAYFGEHIDDVVVAAEVDGSVAVVAIDIPIGLARKGTRMADVAARAVLGHRRSTVFMTPVRVALESADYASAVLASRGVIGKGISVQAFGLGGKILEVDAWVRTRHRTVVEVHPELSFARMAGGVPLSEGKKSWAGAVRRRALLAAEGIELSGNLGLAGLRAGVDDMLDAAAAAWTARRVAAGTATCLPEVPEDLDGWPCAIWT